jgi:fructose-1,6-bisphosphatase II
MNKIAVGPAARGAIDLKASATQNLVQIAEGLRKYVEDLTVVILDRPRHAELIAEVRAAGARIWLIGDGDVSAAIATARPDSGVDVLMGIGGAPEGVISAAALRCMGGDFQGQLVFNKNSERERARAMGIENLDEVYKIHDLASGHVMFCATGVTDGPFLKGVRFFSQGATTQSIVMRSESGTIRLIEAEHHFDKKPRY